MPPLNLDAPYDEFVKQLRSRSLTPSELAEAKEGLTHRLEQIDRQLELNLDQRGDSWKTSVITARKYFAKKLNLIVSLAPSAAKKPAGGYGFLITFLIEGEHVVAATKRNPSELWAEMIAEEAHKDKLPPALIAFLNLTEEAAKVLPESIWVDDL